MRTITHWIDGAEAGDLSERKAPVFDPATGEQQAEVLLAGLKEWSESSLSRRTGILFAFREIVNRRKAELAAAITDEHGKVLSDAAGEVQRGLEVVEFACGIPQQRDASFDMPTAR